MSPQISPVRVCPTASAAMPGQTQAMQIGHRPARPATTQPPEPCRLRDTRYWTNCKNRSCLRFFIKRERPFSNVKASRWQACATCFSVACVVRKPQPRSAPSQAGVEARHGCGLPTTQTPWPSRHKPSRSVGCGAGSEPVRTPDPAA